MLKKLQNISWGGWSAVTAVVLFLGLALYPVISARATGTNPSKKDGFLAMIDKAAKKHDEAKHGHDEHGKKRLEAKALAVSASGTVLLGSKTGLYRVADGKLTLVPALPAADVKALATSSDGTLYVATKMGAYRLPADLATATSIYAGDTHSLTVQPDGTLYLITKMEGIQTSQDKGSTWSSYPVELPLAPAEHKETKEEKLKAHADREANKDAKSTKAPKPDPASTT